MDKVLASAIYGVAESEEEPEVKQYLTFWVDNQLFGMPIGDVIQIIGMQEITPVPEFPTYAKGIINLRGSIIPLVDMRLRLHKEEAAYNERTCTIVSKIEELLVGFIVDGVGEVVSITDEQISQPPKLSQKGNAHAYLAGVGKLEGRVVLLLDTEKILTATDIEAITPDKLEDDIIHE